MENSLFPIEIGIHIAFALVSLIVFGLQYLRFRKKYHLVLAIAIPLSLLPYLAEDNMTLFYAVGAIDALALIAALVLSKTIDKDPAPTEEIPAPEETETEETASDAEQNAVPEEGTEVSEELPEEEETAE